MKLLVVVPWYEPAWGAGGTATAVSALNRQLIKIGVEITVLTTNDAGGGKCLDLRLDKEYNHGGVKVYYYPCNFFIKTKRAFYSSQLIKKIKKEVNKYDLIHIHGTRHAYSIAAAYYAKKNRKKYVITPHASLMRWWMDEIGNSNIKKIYMKFVEAFVIRNCSKLHFLTSEEKIESQKYSFGAESFIVSNGIEVDDFKRDLKIRDKWREKYNVQNKNVLLFLGRIHPQKNLHLIIESMKKLKKTVFFIVGPIGDKNYYNLILNLIEKNSLKDKVFFIPPVSKKEVKFWYWFADFFVSPSVVEGVSMSIIESLASSLPVIVSKNVANYRELLNDSSGIIVKTNTNSISKELIKIEKGYTSKSLLSKNAELSAHKRYKIETVAEEILANYYNIIKDE